MTKIQTIGKYLGILRIYLHLKYRRVRMELHHNLELLALAILFSLLSVVSIYIVFVVDQNCCICCVMLLVVVMCTAVVVLASRVIKSQKMYVLL